VTAPDARDKTGAGTTPLRSAVSALLDDRTLYLPAIGTAIAVVLVVLRQIWIPTGELTKALDWFTFIPLHAIAFVLLGRAAESTRLSPLTRRAWRFFQLSEGIMVVYLVLAGIDAMRAGSGAIPIVIGASSYIPFVFGLLTMPASPRRNNMPTSRYLALAFAMVTMLAVWGMIAQPMLLTVGSTGARGYVETWWATVGDLIPLIALAFLLLRGVMPINRSAIFIVAAAQLVYAITDMMTAQLTAADGGAATTRADAGFFIGALLMGVAGAYQSALQREHEGRGSASPHALSFLRAVVYLSIMAAMAVTLRSAYPILSSPFGIVLLSGATFTGMLVVLPMVTFRDASRAVREQRTQEARFAALAAHASDLTFVVLGDGTISYISATAQRRLSPHQSPLGAFICSFLHPDDAPDARAQLAAAQRSPNVQPHRWRAVASDGAILTLDVVLQDRRSDASIEGMIVNARDVTELIAIEQQALNVQKMEAVGRLAGSIAHDFNNLLTVIRSSATLARLHTPGSPQREGELIEIDRAVDRAAALTRRLLVFGRTREPSVARVDLVAVVHSMQSMLQRLVAKDIALDMALPEEPLWIDADVSYIEQIVLNLALNARDALDGRGALTIQVHRSPESLGARAQIVVHDNGAGIPPAVMSRVFEPFFTTKPLGAGSGLGLATVAAIVRELHGTIDVASEVNVGTTFTISLPIHTQINTPAPIPVAVTVPKNGTGHILVVDDDTDIRNLLSTYLERLGYSVTTAGCGDEALSVLTRTTDVDLILTDLVMANTNGWQLIERLRDRPHAPPIICMSGYADGNRSGTQIDTGITFIEKPFVLTELDAIIRASLSGV